MNRNTQGVSRNGNQAGSGRSRLESAAGRENLGSFRENPPALGAGASPASRPRHDQAAGNHRGLAAGGQASGTGLFGLRITGDTGNAPEAAAVRPVQEASQPGHPAASGVLSASLRASKQPPSAAPGRSFSQARREPAPEPPALPSRTARLKELTARKERVAKKLFATATPADQKPPLEAQWSELVDEIGTLEDTFVFYQGREIDVELVNYLSGVIPTSSEDLDGDEKLYRDGDGRYFLHRHLTHHEREHLHRVSLKGAILWALTRLNSNTLDLRCDAARLLDGKEVAA